LRFADYTKPVGFGYALSIKLMSNIGNNIPNSQGFWAYHNFLPDKRAAVFNNY